MPDLFCQLCVAKALPAPEREYRFAPPRRWRVDYAWPQHKIALEVEGGAWIGGRHTSGSGFMADMEKYNALTLQGWRLLRVTPQQLCTLPTFDMLTVLLARPT